MPADILIGRFAYQDDSSLSASIQDMVSSTRLPYTAVEGMWRKASVLVAETNSVVSAPGFSAKYKMVRSQSGSSPHLVLVIVSAQGVQ